MKEALQISLRGDHLTRAQARDCMKAILRREAQPEQIGAYLASLNFRRPSSEEIVGFVEALREQAIAVASPFEDAVDTCGTGGDGQRTFNISTTAAFVTAAAGCPVAKHGNRSVSSLCGSFDVLEALGVPFYAKPEDARRSFEKHGLAFFFAPLFHPALSELSALRRNLGFRTIFNALGPLLNPAGVKRQLVGVYSETLLDPLIEAFRELGAVNVMVVSGPQGLDEIALNGATQVRHLTLGRVQSFQLAPFDFGMRGSEVANIQGGDAVENAQITLRVLSGEDVGACRDVVLLNAAAALVVGGKAHSFAEGVTLARAALDSGAAYTLLENLRGELR